MDHGGWRSGYHCNSQQHKIGRIADFPTLLASSVFGLEKHEVPQIESQTIGARIDEFS